MIKIQSAVFPLFKFFIVGLLFAGFFFFTNVDFASATTTPRFDQLVKNVMTGSSAQSKSQSISCSDLSGQIETITASTKHNVASFPEYVVLIGFVSGSGFTYRSNDVVIERSGNNIQHDTIFDFGSLSVASLCSNTDYITFRVSINNARHEFAVGGSAEDVYTGGNASATGLADMYFIINGSAETNHPPMITEIEDFSMDEGELIKFIPSATDIDQSFSPSMNITGPHSGEWGMINGVFYWITDFESSGEHEIQIIADDSGNEGIQSETSIYNFTITINDTAPEFNRVEQPIKDVMTPYSAQSKSQTIPCSDLSGHIKTLTLSTKHNVASLPEYVALSAVFAGGFGASHRSEDVIITRAGNNMQSDTLFTFNPPVSVDVLCGDGQENTYFYIQINNARHEFAVGGSAEDVYTGGNASATGLADMYFIINESQNVAPIFIETLSQSVKEGNALLFNVSATDSDGDSLMYSASNLPTGASFDPQTQTFTWTPDHDDAGTYEVLFSVSDGELSDTATVTIEVLNTNRAPVLNTIGNQSVSENQNLTFTISATDPDGDALTYTAADLPSGATFDPQTQTFSWTPGYNDAGNYENVEFSVMDDGLPMEVDVELITITVGNVNRAPVIDPVGAQEVLEEETLTFTVTASDPDNDTFTLAASNFPSGATFDTATGAFNWTPSLSQEGIYTVTFSAADSGTPSETGTIDVVITVGDNPTPIEQSEDIIEDVINLDLPNNVENSYMANLQKVAEFIEQGKIQAAINQLEAFINKVNQDYSQGTLTETERDALIDAAQSLIADID